MRTRVFVGIGILLVLISIGIFSGFAQTPEPSLVNPSVSGGYSLNEGKNLFVPDKAVYPKQLAYLYPEIETISYYDDFLGTHLGYANVFGGVGSNFLLKPGTTYEIVVREPVVLYIP